MSIFTATAKAAMITVPKLFTRPWIIRIPKFITDCWAQVITEYRITLSSVSFLRRIYSLLIRRAGTLHSVYAAIPTPDTAWEITVASAAPATPLSSPATNQISRNTFRTDDTARNQSGTTEFPTERRRQAK